MNCKFLHTTLKQFASGLRTILLVTIYTTVANGQANISGYSDVAKQRLLIRITSHYIYTASQGQIDMDSAIRIPCKLYGLSPLLAYNEGYSDGKPSAGTRLLDAGKVKEARALLAKTHDEARLRLLIELGSYFVFRPGTEKADLDEASKYIKEAILLSETTPDQWKIEVLTLQAFFLDQSGLTDESQEIFAQIVKLCEQTKNTKALAHSLLSAGRLLYYGHPSRLSNFEKALSIFQSLHAKEKEIETLSEMNVEYFIVKRYDVVEQMTHRIIDLQTQINFHHQQYAYDVLAYLGEIKGDVTSSLSYTNKSLQSMTSGADSVFAALFYTRQAFVYEGLHKNDAAMAWYNKALEGRSNDTRLYWYKAFLRKARLLSDLSREEEALSLLREVGSQFPPVTTFEKMYYEIATGESNEKLKRFGLAEEHYKVFLKLAENFPDEYIQGEFADAHGQISALYRIIGKTDKARELLERGKPYYFNIGVTGKAAYYEFLFRIDSTEKRYLDAIKDLQLSQKFIDSSLTYDQRKKVDELLVKYEADKKDKDIQILKQQSELQDSRLQQSQFGQRMTFIGTGLLLLIAALLYYLYRTKQKSNNQLKHLVSEKEWLLKEVHHRVKNNLQTVLSLLESQSRQLSDEALHAIQESKNRVYAMSLIHKKLYQSTDVASINMEDYLRELIQHLRESFGRSGPIQFSLRLEPIQLDVSQAVPVGLIVNEAVTNSIKYAFSESNDDSQIFVSLKVISDKIELLISDNGVGMTETQKETNKSLGLKLMRGLTEDIEGVFAIDTKKGVSIQVDFVPSVPLQKMKTAAMSTPEIQIA